MLYLVATPIGNLGDLSARAIEVLSSVDVIYCEDTRHTGLLLSHFDIKKPTRSLHTHNERERTDEVVAALKDGRTVAYVSDAGMPGISDPGEAMAKLAIDNGITVVPVPGANACLTALVASGLPSTPFFFGAFLPKSKKNRKEQLEKWKWIPATVVLYEAPHRIVDVLEEILAAWGDRQMAFGRELTKLHEEFWRGKVSEAIAYLKENTPRGEFVLVIAQAEEATGEMTSAEPGNATDPLDMVKEKIAQGVPKKEALSEIAKQFKIPRRDLYNRLIQEQEK